MERIESRRTSKSTGRASLPRNVSGNVGIDGYATQVFMLRADSRSAIAAYSDSMKSHAYPVFAGKFTTHNRPEAERRLNGSLGRSDTPIRNGPLRFNNEIRSS